MVRLDVLLAERGLVESRSRAQALVLAGRVRVDGQVVTKAGSNVGADARARGRSRAAVRLARRRQAADRARRLRRRPVGRALPRRRRLDGRLHRLPAAGAARLAVMRASTSGAGQLHERLRQDPRVDGRSSGVNARALEPRRCRSPRDARGRSTSRSSRSRWCCRPSLALPRCALALLPLVKPQFEAGRGQVAGRGRARSRGAAGGARARRVSVVAELGAVALGRVLVGASRPCGQPRVLPAHRQPRPPGCRQAAPRPRCPPRPSRRQPRAGVPRGAARVRDHARRAETVGDGLRRLARVAARARRRARRARDRGAQAPRRPRSGRRGRRDEARDADIVVVLGGDGTDAARAARR